MLFDILKAKSNFITENLFIDLWRKKQGKSPLPKIVSWADGTTAQIKAMLDAEKARKINTADYWNVGDKRTFHLSAISAFSKNGVQIVPAQSAQTVEIALAHKGLYKDMVDDELPSGYKRLVGLEYTGNTYYKITGFKLQGSDTVRLSFAVNKACNVFGCYTTNDATDNYSLYMSTASNAKYLRYDGDVYNSVVSSSHFGDRYDVVITPNGTSGMPVDSVMTPATFTAPVDLCVGVTSPSATSSKLDGKLWGNFVVDGRLKLIPCERLSDNVLGYYDTYSEMFYEPTGSGVVSMGDDWSHAESQTVSWVVTFVDCLLQKGKINGTNTNNGSWNDSAMREYLNNYVFAAMSDDDQALFTRFGTMTANPYNGTSLETSLDHLALLAEKEIFGEETYSNDTEANALTQLDYYKSANSHIKTVNGSQDYWWQRSPEKNYDSAFCLVNIGGASFNPASDNFGIAPFGCI